MKKTLLILIGIVVFCGCAKEKKSREAGLKMQDFVIAISQYARSIDPDFIVIPQNGTELAFTDVDADNSLNQEYLAAIDGLGVEELFYNGSYSLDQYRLDMLRQVVSAKKILVSEYVDYRSYVAHAFEYNYNEGFICFARTYYNYNYTLIPDTIPFENADNITSLSQAKNYLYIINANEYSTKQSFIDAIDATNYDVIIMDLFYNETPYSISEINQLKTKANGAQRLVIAYMNIGSAENFRYYWQDGWKLHNPDWIKKKYIGYDDEFWVEYWNQDWQDIIYGNENSYTKRIINAGFDGAYLDNVEAYYFLYYRN